MSAHLLENIDWIIGIQSVLFLGAVWLLQQWIPKSIKHEFDKEILEIKEGQQSRNEELKAALKETEVRVDRVTHGALQGVQNRQSILYGKQVEAIEEVWDAVTQLAPARGVADLMGNFKFGVVAERSKSDPKLRDFFETIGEGYKIEDLVKVPDIRRHRPFAGEVIWSYYEAYKSIVMFSVGKLIILKYGGDKEFLDDKKLEAVVKAVLPHHEAYITQFGTDGFHHLLEEIEIKLLDATKELLQGKENDEASLNQAAAILTAVRA